MLQSSDTRKEHSKMCIWEVQDNVVSWTLLALMSWLIEALEFWWSTLMNFVSDISAFKSVKGILFHWQHILNWQYACELTPQYVVCKCGVHIIIFLTCLPLSLLCLSFPWLLHNFHFFMYCSLIKEIGKNFFPFKEQCFREWKLWCNYDKHIRKSVTEIQLTSAAPLGVVSHRFYQ